MAAVWYKIEVLCDSLASEAVEFALNELNALGTEIDLLGKRETPDEICVAGYFEDRPDHSELEQRLFEAVGIYGQPQSSIKTINTVEIENRDWLAEWKKNWRPTETGRFTIAPSWDDTVTSEKIVIRIDPAMAFGTGTHETTRLCLQAIEENYEGGDFLDVGTGTGILAIAAAKLANPSSKIVACDTDLDSVKIARENAKLNDATQIEFYAGSITEETQASDFVCANLTADVILPLLPLLFQKATKMLVLSGILAEQKDMVAEELIRLEAKDFSVKIDGEWIAITVSK